MLITSKLEIDLQQPGLKKVAYAVQSDSNTRALEISLFLGSTAWEIPLGTTAAVSFRKMDLTSGLYDTLPDGSTKAVTFSGNTLTAILAPQVLTCAGKVDISIALYDSSLNRLGVFPVLLYVSTDPSAGKSISNNYYYLSTLAAVNEAIGDLNGLKTSTKESLVAAINELAQGTVTEDQIQDAVDAYLEKNGTGSILVDPTLTKEGYAADAKATGEAISKVSGGSAADAVSQHNVATDSHADLRLELQNLADRVNAVLDSDDITLDELSEIVAYIKSNKTLIDAITTSKVSVTDIIDNLVTNVANKPLSAAQGVVLKGMIEEIRGLIPPAYTLPVGGNELGGVKNGGNVTINEDGTMTAPEVSGGSGIAVTGATVGQTVKIAAVDEEGVPTAWEPVDMPSGGGEEWDELANVTLEEESMPFIDIGDYAVNFKKLRFFIVLESMTPTFTRFALGNLTSTVGNLGYNICEISNFGNESGISKLFIEFEPLIEEGFCRASYSWTTMPALSPKVSNFSYQYNSYDYGRLKKARYLYPAIQLPAGTMIAIKGVRA